MLWPGITSQLKQLIQNCPICCRNGRSRKEPLLTTQLPEFFWQVVVTDLFELKGLHYLLAVDYFSRYPEVARLTATTSAAVITAMKGIVAHHGIHELVHSDNGSQYSLHEFTSFAESFEFQTDSKHSSSANQTLAASMGVSPQVQTKECGIQRETENTF